MPRRVFFSFHYERDIWRVNQVRNSWVTQGNQTAAGFIDAAEFEQIQRSGESAVTRWIDRQLDGTSVTVVLVGAETANRPYVQYEVEQSLVKRNGVVAIYINGLKDRSGSTDFRGSNPLANIRFSDGTLVSNVYHAYDWVRDDGYNNLSDWIEEAAQIAGR